MKKVLILALVSVLILFNGCQFGPEAGSGKDISFIPFDEIPIEGKAEEPADEPPQLPVEQPELIQEVIQEEPESPETAPEVKPVENKDLPQIIKNETELVKLRLKATDPDGDPITYTYSAPLNENGEWQTKAGDAGEYKVRITASDGKSTTTQDLLIIIKSRNQPPVMQNINDIVVNEGQIVSLSPVTSDPENEPVQITYSGWMSSSSYKTNYDDAGTHTVTVTASDGTNQVSQDINVVINNVNRAPILSELGDIIVKEGETVKLSAVAADPDNEPVTIEYSAPLNDNGEWETEVGDAGEYEVIVTASDGKIDRKKDIMVTVTSLNKPPVLNIAAEVNVEEGETVRLIPVATDPEGEEVVISYSGWMSSSTYETDYDDAGTHTVTITASDGINEVTKEVTVNVEDVNRPPEFVWE
ncbi:hypothetical protein CMO89_04685 [Candidatus Woesearchaeota archaeon]|nr:hypothetical protein [Candidatus Woesearchaeota archaeon]|tara:strand:+ start:3801 stop:5045 length:1245 start_codon:yes stop_codon:yes gene_type:complete